MPYARNERGKLVERKKTPEQVIESVRHDGIRFLDLQFSDIPGRLQHTTIPTEFVDLEVFMEGVPKLDGSSIRGFTDIHESDMVLVPDPSTFGIVPWGPPELKTARMLCDIYWGFGMGRFARDPRGVAQTAEKVAREEGYEKTYWGPEVEFFVFDSIKWDVLTPYHSGSYTIESREAAWDSSGKGYPIRFKEGYYPAAPQDTLQDYRSECVSVLYENFGVACDAHHHEVSTAGQCEIDMHYDTLTNMADSVMTYKYVVKNIATKHGMIATMMPKPIFLDNASGMHVHVSLWSSGRNLFYDESDAYAELSQLGRYFGGGLMEHSRALTAITNPTTNSYRRLVPGFEAPVYIAWSRRNRSANVRIPVYLKGERNQTKKRIEFRTPDSSANPYLAFAAMLAAGLDGIRKKIDIGDPTDEDIYKLSPERRKQLGIKQLPGSLREAVECLESDKEFLKGIFTSDLVDVIVENGIKEHGEVSRRPHPYEYYLYMDI